MLRHVVDPMLNTDNKVCKSRSTERALKGLLHILTQRLDPYKPNLLTYFMKRELSQLSFLYPSFIPLISLSSPLITMSIHVAPMQSKLTVCGAHNRCFGVKAVIALYSGYARP
jgi:hypothetical protein